MKRSSVSTTNRPEEFSYSDPSDAQQPELSLVPMKVTRDELQRVTKTVKEMSRKEFDTLETAYVGDLAKLSLAINDKLKISSQYSALAI